MALVSTDIRASDLPFYRWFLLLRGHDLCGPTQVREFLAYLTHGHSEPGGRWGNPHLTQPVRPRTVRDYHSHLRTFFRWLIAQKMITESPIENIGILTSLGFIHLHCPLYSFSATEAVKWIKSSLDDVHKVLTSPHITDAEKRAVAGRVIERVTCQKDGADVTFVSGLFGEVWDATIQIEHPTFQTKPQTHQTDFKFLTAWASYLGL